MKPECPFCSESVQKAVFKRSANFLAICNIAPVFPGHVLIIPEKHISRFMELPEEEMCEMVSFSREVVRLLEKAYHTNSFDWTIQEGEPAGQTVDHMHLHIIPRKSGDLEEPGDWYHEMEHSGHTIIDSSQRKQLSEEEIKKWALWLRETDEKM